MGSSNRQEYQRKYWLANKETLNTKQRAYWSKNKDVFNAKRRGNPEENFKRKLRKLLQDGVISKETYEEGRRKSQRS